MSRASAWILGFRGNHQAAVGELELAHVLADEPESFHVPGSPAYCHRVIVWEDNVVPLIDIGELFETKQEESTPRHFGIVRYRLRPTDRQRFGAFLMDRIPQRAHVDDASAYALPDALAGWRDLVISCFVHEERPIPILDLCSVFSGVRAAA